MPKKKKNEVKPDPKPVLKGVIGIVVPKKTEEASTPVYKYFNDNAEYSENKCTSTEDTKSFRLQIEQYLNDFPQIDKCNIKTDNLSSELDNPDGFLKTLHNDENIDTCFNIIKKAVDQIEVVEKKSEIMEVKETPKMPKTNLLVPLEMVKEKDGDFFKGTKHRKEKKVKEKKHPKLIRLDEIQEVDPGAVYQIDIQPTIINRWQEKQGNKLFENQPDPEEAEEQALLAIVMRESIKTAKMEKEKRLQEDLVYDEINRDIKRDKLNSRGNSLTTILDEKCQEIVIDDATLALVRGIKLPESDSAWDDELEELKREQEKIRAKKERKTSLNKRLKQLENYGPNIVQDLVPKKQRENKKRENKESESAKLKAEENKENSDELVFIDPEEEKEEADEKKKDNISTIDDSIMCNVFANVPEDLIDKTPASLSIINQGGAIEMNVVEEKLQLKTDKYHSNQIYWNSTVHPVDKGLPTWNDYKNNNREKYEFDKPGRMFFKNSDNKIEKPNVKTEQKVNLWNLTAKADAKGFSSEYQNRRREAKDSPNKLCKPNVEIFKEEDIPQFRSARKKNDFEVFDSEDIPDIVKKDCDGPFQDFEDDVSKLKINDLSNGKTVVTSSALDISEEVVVKALEKILFQQFFERECSKLNNPISANQSLQSQVPYINNSVQNLLMNSSEPMLNLPQTTDQQQQINSILQQIGLPQVTNQQQVGMTNEDILNRFLQQGNTQPTEMTDPLHFFNNSLQQNIQTIPNSSTNQHELLRTLSEQNNPPTDHRQLFQALQHNSQQAWNAPPTTDQQQVLDVLQHQSQQLPKLSETTDQEHFLNLLQRSTQQLGPVQKQEIGLSSKPQVDPFAIEIRQLQVDPNDSLPQRSNNPQPIDERVQITESCKAEENMSIVETLQMKILRLETELAKQQQQLEQRGPRSESSESQEPEVVEEIEENKPAENPPAKPGFPNQFAEPFQPRYAPQSGMFNPYQMYYYVPTLDPTAMGPMPPVPPYMGPMMLPVRPPGPQFMPGPI